MNKNVYNYLVMPPRTTDPITIPLQQISHEPTYFDAFGEIEKKDPEPEVKF